MQDLDWRKLQEAKDGFQTWMTPVEGGWLYMVRSFSSGDHAVSITFVPHPPTLEVSAASMANRRVGTRNDR